MDDTKNAAPLKSKRFVLFEPNFWELIPQSFEKWGEVVKRMKRCEWAL